MALKKQITLIFILFFTTSSFAQYQITIDVVVFDNETNKPIPYVNVGFNNKDVKTVGDSNGKLTLIYDEEAIGKKDILQFSSLGYKTLQIKASRLFKFFKNTNKVYLIPKSSITTTKVANNVLKGNIYGKVFSVLGPLQGVTIKLKNSFTEVQTDAEGLYRIEAEENDVLIINFLGMKEKHIVISDTNKIDIKLEIDGEALDEVTVTGTIKKEELIDLGFGSKKSFNAIGTSINIITDKDIAPHYDNLADVLVGQFAGVSVGRNPLGNAPTVFIHRGGSIVFGRFLAIYDIDGQIFSHNDQGGGPPYVDPQNVKSITILKSLAATNKYGSRGRGGVVVIRTKKSFKVEAVEPKKTALVKGNNYTEELPIIATVEQTPTYIKDLEKAGSYKEALVIYKSQKRVIEQVGIPFYIEVSSYFMRWDKDFALNILSEISAEAYNNPTALKTLAYRYEELNLLEEAKQIYQHIAVLRPKEAQSYRDLALIYKETGNYKSSINLYKQMLGNTIDSVSFSGLRAVLENEVKHLLAKHRNKVDFKDFSADFLKADFKYDRRLVFEWNEPYAEFDIQFVNPQQKYFTWSHSKFNNKKRLFDEIKKGYHTEEYIIDDSDTGEWLINIKSLNTGISLNPTYLKYTLYTNYGLPNETKEVKLIKLYQHQENVTLDKFSN